MDSTECRKERELVTRLQAGEPEAFDRLYEKYQAQAYRTAVLLTGDRTEAQDVTQNTFVTVYQEIGKLREPAAFRSWFYRILANNATRSIMNRKREILQGDQEISGERADEREDIPDMLVHREECRRFHDCIAGMDEKHRTVLVLFYYNDFSVEQIAEIMGCVTGTVKSRLFHARKKLEQRLRWEANKDARENVPREYRKSAGDVIRAGKEAIS